MTPPPSGDVQPNDDIDAILDVTGKAPPALRLSVGPVLDARAPIVNFGLIARIRAIVSATPLQSSGGTVKRPRRIVTFRQKTRLLADSRRRH